MRTLHISVLDKKAIYANRDGDIVCGNNDYMIEFAFDAEWDGYDEKTARFIWNGQYQDVKFEGTACYVPIVTHTTELRVGVYAGELSTTTSATIPCQKSVLCDSSSQGGTIIINNGPALPEGPREGQYIQDDFSLGLWNRSERKLGTFYDCENMAGELDTCISSRIPRRRWMNLSDPIQGMLCSKDALYFACDGEMMMSLSENRVQVLGTVSKDAKLLAPLGRYVLILPDFKIYDTVTEKLINRYVRLALVNVVIQNNKTLYCADFDFTPYVVAGDAIRIAGTASNNGYYTIRSVQKNYLHFDDNTFVAENLTATTYVLIDSPVMKGLCTAKDRIWGWNASAGSSTFIYATSPDNPTRWYRYDNDAVSSYKVKILSDVALTACVSFSDRPIFFSDTSMIEVVGDSPANFKLVETSMHGVKPGCAASLCVVGDKMLYISDAGVVSCDGKTATVISDALGKNFVSGIATSDGRRYYLSAEDEQGVKALYIYDTITGSWFKEDDKNDIKYLGYVNGDVFAYCSNLVIYILGENKTGHGTTLGAVSSFVEFHPLVHPAHTEIVPKNIELQVDCEADTTLTLSVRYDDGEWEECGQLQSEGKQFWSVPLEERTCRSLGIRLDGVGAYKVLYMSAEYVGDALSDVPPITARDVGKVLTAGKGGTAEWKEPTGGEPEVVDFTPLFDLAESVAAGGEQVAVHTVLAERIMKKLQSGPVKIKVSFSGLTASAVVHAQDFGTYCQFTDFVLLNGALLYIFIFVSGEDESISFQVQQVVTTPYNPS